MEAKRSLVVQNPRFRHFLLASTVSLIGSNVFDIAIPLYVLQRRGSVLDLSFASLALYLPHFLMAPLTGYWSDHQRKRYSLLLSDCGQIVFLLLLSGYIAWGGNALWPILASVFLVKSLMLTFETICQFQLIPALVGHSGLASGNTWFLSLHRVIQIIGPLLGGMLLHYSGIQSCLWVNILSFLATIHFAWSFKQLDQVLSTESPGYPVKAGSSGLSPRPVARKFKRSVVFIWRSPVFRPFILLMFLWNLSSLTLNSPSLTYFFTVTHGFSAAQYGFVISSFGMIGILGFLISPWLYQRRPFHSVFEGASLVQAGFGTLCALPLGMPVFMGAMYGLSRTGSSVLSMGTYFIRQTQVPRDQNGAINASLRMFFMSAAPLSSLLQGWIIHTFGITPSLVLGALCLWGAWWYARVLSQMYPQSQPHPQPETRVAGASG